MGLAHFIELWISLTQAMILLCLFLFWVMIIFGVILFNCKAVFSTTGWRHQNNFHETGFKVVYCTTAYRRILVNVLKKYHYLNSQYLNKVFQFLFKVSTSQLNMKNFLFSNILICIDCKIYK